VKYFFKKRNNLNFITMGTRHLQTVIDKNGKKRVNQYGQWDGYPSGQGLDVLNYLKTGDLEQYQKNLQQLKKITKKQDAMVEADPNWEMHYPYLSRDCGSKIHNMIEMGTVEFVHHISESEAQKWCEGFYTIDFKKGVFTSEFGGIYKEYPLDNLPSKRDYLSDMEDGESFV